MSFYITADLIEATGDVGLYEFESDGRKGRFTYNAVTAEVVEQVMMPGDESQMHVSRAARAVYLAHQRDGVLPKLACWAS